MSKLAGLDSIIPDDAVHILTLTYSLAQTKRKLTPSRPVYYYLRYKSKTATNMESLDTPVFRWCGADDGDVIERSKAAEKQPREYA
jgi:hypothetical protein